MGALRLSASALLCELNKRGNKIVYQRCQISSFWTFLIWDYLVVDYMHMEELNTKYQNHSGVFVPLSLVIDKRIADLVMLKISIRIRIRSSRKTRIQPPSKEPTLEKTRIRILPYFYIIKLTFYLFFRQ